MALTPADVHNVAFSRARIGKRGYCEQEVDLFIDLVEQELVRHVEGDADLRRRNAELRNRDGGLQKREADLAEREAALRDYEGRVRQREAQLRHREAQLARQASPLPQQVAQLRHREAQVAQREATLARHGAELAQREARLAQREAEIQQQEADFERHESQLEQREAELGQHETELRRYEAELRQHQAALRQRIDQQQAVAARISSEASTNQTGNQVTNQVARRHPQQLRGALTKAAAVNGVKGTARLEETRAVAAVRGRHDIERMAIRAVTDTHGNVVTETVHERTRRSAIEDGGLTVASEPTALIEQLKQENAELARSLALLKSAAAALATALEGP
jgi:DivIVA domain-containing protein